MKEIIVVVGLVLWMLSAMADTQAYGKRNTAEIQSVQTEIGGESAEYVHGNWCMDGRVF